MGTIKQGILGGFSGKVGSVIGSSWKGIATMRSQPLSVTNPRTNAQVENRNRFSNVVSLAKSLLSTVVRPLNDRFAQGMSGYNLFVSRNKNAFLPNGSFDTTKFVLSSGKLGKTNITSVAPFSVDQLEVFYSTTPEGDYQSNSDFAYVVALDGDGNVLATSSAVETRASGSVKLFFDSVPLSANFYLSFLRADGSMVGNSSFYEL